MNAVPFYLERTSHGTSSVTLESALYEHRIFSFFRPAIVLGVKSL